VLRSVPGSVHVQTGMGALGLEHLVVRAGVPQLGTGPGTAVTDRKTAAGYNGLHPEYEPATGRRDPVFWTTLAVAEQDFDGSGDLCIRCHSAGGWYGGRSTPTGGSRLAADLQVFGGSLDATYQAALLAGTGGNYEDGTPRFFSCQSCHMRPVESVGCNKNGAPLRKDLPMHDQTGGNYWFANMVQYQDSQGHLRLGGGLTGNQILAMDLGQQRAVKHLQQAAFLLVEGDNLKVVNLTGHKLISGYPEGRRMWLNIKWYDANGSLLREDGEYGPIGVSIPNPAGGPDVEVESIVDLHDPNTRIYEAHYAMTKEWADTLLAVGKPASLPLSFDRATGAVDFTLGHLAAMPAGSYHETFHFVLNNYVASDNRIPPYGMRYDEAQKRNALPVPDTQYGGGTPGSVNNYWDQLDLNALVPTGAVTVQVTVNSAGGGLQAGVAYPLVTGLYSGKGKNQTFALNDTFAPGDTVVIRSTVVDSNGNPVANATVTTGVTGPESTTLTATSDANGVAEASWNTQAPNKRGQGGTATGSYTATTSDVTADGYTWDGVARSVGFQIQ